MKPRLKTVIFGANFFGGKQLDARKIFLHSYISSPENKAIFSRRFSSESIIVMVSSGIECFTETFLVQFPGPTGTL